MTDSMRRQGKTAALAAIEAAYLKEHPNATIIRIRNGETIIEKPVKAASDKKGAGSV
jgi:hypothetical protein